MYESFAHVCAIEPQWVIDGKEYKIYFITPYFLKYSAIFLAKSS